MNEFKVGDKVQYNGETWTIHRIGPLGYNTTGAYISKPSPYAWNHLAWAPFNELKLVTTVRVE